MSDENAPQKGTNIIVNSKKYVWSGDEISYSEVVNLAYPNHADTQIFTVQFSDGPRDRQQGTLVEGESIKVIENEYFDVSTTDKS